MLEEAIQVLPLLIQPAGSYKHGSEWSECQKPLSGSALGKEAAPAAARRVQAALAVAVQVLAAGAGSAIAGRSGHALGG